MTNETKSRKRGSVLCYAGRLAALVCLAVSTVQAAEVTITVKGTVALDSPDDYGIFQVGKDLKGQTFTLTITFDDSKSVVRVTNGSSVSEISQTSGSSPARVVLKIGPGSYVFGTKPESKWSAYKSTDPKSGCCGGIGFHVMEGIYPQTSLLWLKLEPAIGGKPLYGSVEWQTPISSAQLDGDPMASQFRITRPGDYQRVTRGRLMPQSMTEGPSNGADSAQINDAPAKNGEQAAIVDPSGGLSGTSTKGAGRSEETRAGDGIIITVKGKVSIGHDDYGIFKVGRDLTGQGFTLVFTFSEAANHHHHMCGDQADGTSYFGSAKDVSAKAVLTIGNGSFVFGAQPDRSWGAFRGIPSECMVDEIAMNVKEGVYPQTTLLWVKLQPPPGGKPLNTSIDWNSPLSSLNLDNSPLLSSFGISHPNDYEHSDHGVLIAESVTVGVGNAGEAQPSPKNSGAAPNTPGDSQGSSNVNGESPAVGGNGSSSQGTAKPPQSLKDRFRKAVQGLLPKVAVPNP